MNIITSQKSEVRFVEIGETQVNQRLDNFLLKTLKNIPKSRVYRIIRKGEVRVNKKRSKPDYKLSTGDVVRIPPLRIESVDTRETFIAPDLIAQVEKAVLFENKHLLVIDKPAGLAVHSGTGISFGVIDIVRRLRPQTDVELVHRLDRDTSGCLLLAKNRQSLLEMQHCLQSNKLRKSYLALVKGDWPAHVTEISHALKRTTMSNGERRVYPDPDGQKALTRVTGIDSGQGCSLLSIQLVTGRTHQIRVHCQAEGHEIAGDSKYGDPEFNKWVKKQGVKRLMLHASRLELPHTEFNPEIVINAVVPPIFNQLVKP